MPHKSQDYKTDESLFLASNNELSKAYEDKGIKER